MRRLSAVRRLARSALFVLVAAGGVAPAAAADIPLAGSVYYLQTSGPTAGIGIGDYYTDTGGGGAGGDHYYTIEVPCGWPSGTPIHIDIFSPEMHTGGGSIDEPRGAGNNTIFEIYGPGTTIGGSPANNTPGPGAAGSLGATTYVPTAGADAWVRFFTIASPNDCETYVLRTETEGDDDNGWRLRASGDDDANPTTAPPAGADAGIAVAQKYGTWQHSGPNPSCLSLWEYYAAAGTTVAHNFDLDGGATITYFPPEGSSVTGTVSGNGVWNNGGTASVRAGDSLTVAANQIGYWRIEVCATPNNQFIFEGATAPVAYASLPLGSSITKTDGVTTAQHNGYLSYTITFTNNSIPTGAVAENVVIRDVIPTNTTFDSCVINAPYTGSCSFSAGVITFTINETVTAGSAGTVTANVLVNDPAAGSTVVNTVHLDYTDDNGFRYPRETATDTDQLPTLQLTKTSSNPSDTGDGPQVGDTITYTMVIENVSGATQNNIVVNDAVPAGTTYVANSTTATGPSLATRTMLDQFATNGSYAGNNGTHNFTAAWVEIGEADGAGAGSQQVTGNALRVGDNDTGSEGVSRAADMTIAGGTACAATLSFNVREIGLDGGEDVSVAISGNGGTSFTTLETFDTGLGGAFVARSYNLTAAQATATTVVRFLSDGSLEGGEYLEVDNVQLQNVCSAVVTKDNVAGGGNDLGSGVPPTLVQAADNFDLDPGETLTVTFNVTVTVAGPITNTATATSAEDTDPAQGSVRDVALTRAAIAGIRISGGAVEFATIWQQGTRGFHLHSSDSRLRRADRTRLNGDLIKAPRPDSSTPILYRVDAAPQGRYLWIEEVEVGDRSGRLMGPFDLEDADLERRFERIELRLAGRPQEERASSRSVRRGRSGSAEKPRPMRRGRPSGSHDARTGVKIFVDRAGEVTVPWADLTAAGLPPRFIHGGRALRLSSLGDATPFAASAAGLTFTARATASDHSAENVYVLTWNGAAPAPKVAVSRSEPPVAAGFTRIQKNWIYYQAAPRGSDPWLWDLLSSGETWPPDWDPTQGDFDLPGFVSAGGDVPLRITLVGRTPGRHSVAATLNGVAAGEVAFEGTTLATLEGSVPASSLRAAGNQLRLSYASDEPGGGYAYVNYLDLGLVLPPGTGRVAGVESFDATLPASIRRADYLIVSHEDFLDAAAAVEAHKERSGRSAVVVDVARAYDRYTAGLPDATAVRALIAEASRARSVLIVGDDTIDPADNYDLGERVFVPSGHGWDRHSGRVASENVLADRDSDSAPDVAIGRIPARTAAEAAVAASKIASSQGLLAPASGRHVIAVDNQGIADAPFRAEGRRIEATLGGSSVFADVSLGAASARAALLDGLAAGAETTTYVGHGAPAHWADEGLFDAADASRFADAGHATVLLTWSCLSSDYRYFWGHSVSEAMTLVPNGGAAASFGPTGLSLPTLQREVYRRLYPKLLAGMAIGDAVREVKREVLVALPSDETRDFLHGWALLGDPDVRLPR